MKIRTRIIITDFDDRKDRVTGKKEFSWFELSPEDVENLTSLW